MMLSEFQRTQVWEGMLESEIRALNFADLTAATLIGKFPQWVPILSATFVALASAYYMAAGLDPRTATMAKLHSAWSQLGADYERPWSHIEDDNAEAQLNEIIRVRDIEVEECLARHTSES